MPIRILHIAPYNTAGVPMAFVKAEQKLGQHSRLVTLHHDSRGYREDICLELPLWQPEFTAKIKRIFYPKTVRTQDANRAGNIQTPPVWRPANRLSGIIIKLRDRITRPAVIRAIKKHRLDEFDVHQLDGGHGFLKYDNIISQWHTVGKKVICCYLGSDLRRRGLISEIDQISDLNITLEWDHLTLYPGIKHVLFPFDYSNFQVVAPAKRSRLIIGHSPTNRKAKGSYRIIAAVDTLARKFPVELRLIENVPHAKALELKAGCDIGIDQLGELGYGISALEWMAMGIPVASCVAGEMEKEHPDHPIVAIDDSNIEMKLEGLINDQSLRRESGRQCRRWLEQHHDSQTIVKQIHEMAGLCLKEFH